MSTVTRSTLALFRKLKPSHRRAVRVDRKQAAEFLHQEEKRLWESAQLFMRLISGEADYLDQLEHRFLEQARKVGL